jgi:hypothetical protein
MCLWSLIMFNDPPPYDRSLAFFERAGTAPLDLCIDRRNKEWNEAHNNDRTLSEDDHPYTPEMMGVLMDHLLRKIHLIRTLIVFLDTWPAALTVLSKLRDAGEAPVCLKRFELHNTGRPLSRIGSIFEPVNHRGLNSIVDRCVMPRLDYLALGGVHTDWNFTHISNLTVLDLRSLTWESSPTLVQFRNTLSACPNLCNLALSGAGPQWRHGGSYPPGLQPIELRSLTVFTLGDFSVNYALYCLETFRAPNLISLAVISMTRSDCGPLLEALTGRFPEVQVLTIHNVRLEQLVSNKIRLINWLKSMPKVNFLKVGMVQQHVLRAFLEDSRKWDGSSVNIYAPKTDIIPLCPNLKLLGYHSLHLDWITTFIDERRKMGVPLKKLFILEFWHTDMELKDRELLENMIPTYMVVPTVPILEERTILQAWCHSKGIPVGYRF